MEETREEKIERFQKEGLVSRAYQNSILGRILVIASLLIALIVFWFCYDRLRVNIFIAVIIGIIINQIFIFVADRIITKLLIKKIETRR